jgi:hypothetical protein
MSFRSKITIFILAVLFSVMSFGHSTFAAKDITSQLKIEPKSIKSSGREWSIDISGQNVKEGDWATFRAENVSLIPGGKVDLKYKGDKIGEILVDKKYSDGHELNYQSVVRNDENAKPGSIVWQGKIVFNKNIEKYADFKSSISNNNTNYFSYVNRDVTVETKIIGSTTLKGEDVKLTKRALLNYNNTTVNGSAAEFNTNNDVSRFSGAITISKNNPIKAGDKIKFSMHEDSSIRFIDKDFPVGTKLWFSKSREGISSSTPVNKYGVYFAGGPSIEFKIISRSDSEIIIEAMNNSAPIDGVYGAWISSIKVIDGSMVKNGVISGVKYTVEAIAKDGKVINKRDFNQNASIYGSNVETYAKIRRPEAKPQKPAPVPTPAQPQPAVETPKAEKPSEGKVQAPNTGFEKSQNFIILAFAVLGVTTAVVFRKKLAKIKI